jgi:translation initiation factor IF-3
MVRFLKLFFFVNCLIFKKKKLSDAKKHQTVIQVKEIKISPKIGEHDYQIKMNQAIRFLQEGKRVKITLIFRRRENATRNDRGPEIFAKIDKTFEEKDLLKNLSQEKDAKAGSLWCRIYFLKNTK